MEGISTNKSSGLAFASTAMMLKQKMGYGNIDVKAEDAVPDYI